MGDQPAVAPVRPYRCGEPVTVRSSLADIGAAASFGAQDPGYEQITALLAKRKCVVVGDLDDWTQGEITAMIRGADLKLAKQPSVYVKTLQVYIKRDIALVRTSDGSAFYKVKKKTGGDTLSVCRKVEDRTFNWTKYHPDALVYAHVPKMDAQEYIEDEEEKLHLDLLWLCLQVSCHAPCHVGPVPRVPHALCHTCIVYAPQNVLRLALLQADAEPTIGDYITIALHAPIQRARTHGAAHSRSFSHHAHTL